MCGPHATPAQMHAILEGIWVKGPESPRKMLVALVDDWVKIWTHYLRTSII
jgi:hypothetical protein